MADQFFNVLKEVGVFLICGCLAYVAREIHKARESVVELNTKIAVILTQLENYGKMIEKHDDRISELERFERG